MLEECSLQREYSDSLLHQRLFTSLGHEELYLTLVDADHCLPEVFAELSKDSGVIIVCDSLDDGLRPLDRVAALEYSASYEYALSSKLDRKSVV